MRTMYDSVTWQAIPANAAMVAGYIDSIHYTWPAEAWARFPSAVRVRIATQPGTNDGHVGDCEAGDMTPAQLVSWVQLRRRAGADPTGYCSLAAWPSCRAAFSAAGVKEPYWWVAGYPGPGPVIPTGAIAHQYANAVTSGGNYDLSVVNDFWPGVDTMSDPFALPSGINKPDGTPYSYRDLIDWIDVFANQIPGLASQLSTLESSVTTLQTAVATLQSTVNGLGKPSGTFTITGSGSLV